MNIKQTIIAIIAVAAFAAFVFPLPSILYDICANGADVSAAAAYNSYIATRNLNLIVYPARIILAIWALVFIWRWNKRRNRRNLERTLRDA